METPKSGRQRKPVRNPTPRLSERKKSLFAPRKTVDEVDEDILSGIVPIDNSITTAVQTLSHKTVSESGHKNVKRRSLRLQKSNSPGSDMETNGKENVPMDSAGEEAEEQLQVLFSASMRLGGHQSPKTFLYNATDTPESTKDKCSNKKAEHSSTETQKRQYERDSTSNRSESPKSKQVKVETTSLEKLSISTKSFYSVAKVSPTSTLNNAKPSIVNYISPNVSPRSKRHDRRKFTAHPNINKQKGVRHKIRRPAKPFGSNYRQMSSVDVDVILNNLRNEKLRKLITAKREENVKIEKIHKIFRNNNNPIAMARPLSALGFIDDSNNNNNYSKDTADGYLNNKEHLNEKEAAFSDIEYEDESCEEGNGSLLFDGDEEVIPIITHQYNRSESRCSESPTKSDERSVTPTANKKFFKSGRSTNTRKEIKITENIRASMCNGKISLVQDKKQYRRKQYRKNTAFSDEQEAVNAILENLNDTTYGDVVEKNESAAPQKSHENESEICTNEIQRQQDTTDYSDFRKRLPYKTSDPELIEQQHLLLDFLISNNICTEKNFIIFIADPENHREEASRIVDQVIVVVNENSDFGQRLPYNTTDPILIEQQYSFLDFLILNNICTEENFDIFIANYETRRSEADSIMANFKAQYQQNADTIEPALVAMDEDGTINCVDNSVVQNNDNMKADDSATVCNEEVEKSTGKKLFPIFNLRMCQPLVQQSTRRIERSWTGGKGSNQYQIDAGQKNFGAQQCKQCGLVYTVHEPEEEKLHRDYHASLHVLRFKSWIDEDVVAIFLEWGADGRILRVTENSHIRRRERLMDILKIVDKELGFSSYIMPKTFVAYFAVRKCQIVGLCLVQPLTKAHKYLSINGVDCCTEEEYEAKCGISRIWVSPLHRGLYIASKLLEAVQLNTIIGEEIPLDKIAFSAPTESGKLFAQKVTKMTNFLVYQ